MLAAPGELQRGIDLQAGHDQPKRLGRLEADRHPQADPRQRHVTDHARNLVALAGNPDPALLHDLLAGVTAPLALPRQFGSPSRSFQPAPSESFSRAANAEASHCACGSGMPRSGPSCNSQPATGSAMHTLLRSQGKGEWCPGAESNHRHCDFQSHALPTELPGRPAKRVRSVLVERGIEGDWRAVQSLQPALFELSSSGVGKPVSLSSAGSPGMT